MISLAEINKIIDEKDPSFLEELAQKAKSITQQYFGRTISLYTPLYLSNYCSSHCIYCGFHSRNRIQRTKLSFDEMEKEMACIAQYGIENILLLTGESPTATDLSYFKKSIGIAKKYFSSIGIESYPMDTEQYKALFCEGLDAMTIYQETYDRKRYNQVHLSGKKTDYDYRKNTPQRAALAGIRNISMGILLGLGELSNDLLALYEHLRCMEKTYSGVEYSLSFPRLQPIRGKSFAVCDIDDATFIKIICLTRILFPRIGINLSTRERSRLRDHAIELGITRISAGSNTSVGGYSIKSTDEQDPQFDIEDDRSVNEIIEVLKQRNFDPILTDWRRIEND